LPQVYDDPGYSGGNMERPALKRLLADIVARRMDVVVVYKVDRLTRSLADSPRSLKSSTPMQSHSSSASGVVGLSAIRPRAAATISAHRAGGEERRGASGAHGTQGPDGRSVSSPISPISPKSTAIR
jgi:hypothetical protein